MSAGIRNSSFLVCREVLQTHGDFPQGIDSRGDGRNGELEELEEGRGEKEGGRGK